MHYQCLPILLDTLILHLRPPVASLHIHNLMRPCKVFSEAQQILATRTCGVKTHAVGRHWYGTAFLAVALNEDWEMHERFGRQCS